MEAGRDLDALVAEHVLGWAWWPYAGNREQRILAPTRAAADTLRLGDDVRQLVPASSTDIAAAWRVIGALAARGHHVRLVQAPPPHGTQVSVLAAHGPDDGAVTATAVAPTTAHAICLAALAAVGVALPPAEPRP